LKEKKRITVIIMAEFKFPVKPGTSAILATWEAEIRRIEV
jgi:hypothetical protein